MPLFGWFGKDHNDLPSESLEELFEQVEVSANDFSNVTCSSCGGDLITTEVNGQHITLQCLNCDTEFSS